MAKIPDASSLGERRIPVGRSVAYQDDSAEIMAGAIGGAARQLGGVVTEFADRRDEFRVAKAGAEFSKLESAARNFEDNDWETYEDRYRKTLTQAKEGILKNIKLPRNREALNLELDSAIERGAVAVKGVARAKEVEFGRADLSSTLDTFRTSALSVGDEESRTANIKGAQMAIKSAMDNRYIDPTDAERINKEWTKSYAEGFVSMQTADRRIDLLSKPSGVVADYIAPDKRAALLEAAKRESRDLTVKRESQAQEDAIVDKYGTSASALSKAREIKDPEVRDSTVNRIKIRQAEAKLAEAEAHDATAEEALAFINGGGKYVDLPLNIKNGLKPSELNSLRAYAEQQAGGGTRRTQPETLIELSELSASDPQAFGETSMLVYRDRLSDADFEEFVDLQRKIKTGTLDGKASGFMSINQIRDVRLREIFGGTTAKGDKQAKINRFVTQFESELKAFKETKGNAPRADDARKILDNLTAEVAINWGRDKPVYALDAGDIPDVPDADRTEIIRELQRRGKPVSDQAIIDLYRKVNAK